MRYPTKKQSFSKEKDCFFVGYLLFVRPFLFWNVFSQTRLSMVRLIKIEDENQDLELARVLKINLFLMHSKIENHLIFLMSDNCDQRKLTSRFFNNNPSMRLSNSNFSQRSFPSFSSYKIRNRASPPSSIYFNSPT